jgi:hypothetical protein
LQQQPEDSTTHWKEVRKMRTKDDLDNYANQLNPNNDEYWHSRGEEKP